MAETREAESYVGRFAGLQPGEMVDVDATDLPVPAGCLIDVLDMEVTHAGPGAARALMRVGPQHLNQAGVVQAGAIVSFADATAGWASRAALRSESAKFSTLELNVNLLRAGFPGDVLEAKARPVHLGRTTMVIQVDVFRQAEPPKEPSLVASFRCTQMVIG